ncbi:MAG TPA: cyclic nucleotide-binding domain-containing protein [Burkholderiales bacterium]|nr:cyclic nucleotide-binding domain-containing protein [Burkholderiales bacterium]
MSTQASPPAQRATAERLSLLAPLEALSPERLRQLAEVAVVERAARGSDPLATHRDAAHSIFLLRGEILLMYAGGGTLVVVGGMGDGRHPLNRGKARIARSRAISDLELLSVNGEVLDILVTFDQLAGGDAAAASAMGQAVRSDAHLASGIFSLSNLRHGVFAQLPAARIEQLLARFEQIGAKRGEVVIREGEEGDYYYVIEAGRCRVERLVGGVKVALAELKSGDAFGEEALASAARRNATVTMATDGKLLRLGKKDFNELLGEPLLQRVAYAEALERVSRGAVWLDVRYPSEYRYDRLPGAINVPLNEVRNSFPVLDPSREYIVYCQSGRRSSAAAFLFAQRGFKVALLEGGLWAAGRGR